MSKESRIVYLITGSIKSGKTTKAMNLFRDVKSKAGIFSPVIDNKRFIYSIHDRRLIALESDETTPESEIVRTKNYCFKKSSFQTAHASLREAAGLNTEWFIIDELGILEMRGEGYEPVLSGLIPELPPETKILMIVREDIVRKAEEKYDVQFIPLPVKLP